MTDLKSELKAMIVDVLSLEDVSADDIGDTDNLFAEDGLALDSIDALELGVAIQKSYGVKLDAKDDKVARNFQTVDALAALIESARNGGAAQ